MEAANAFQNKLLLGCRLQDGRYCDEGWFLYSLGDDFSVVKRENDSWTVNGDATAETFDCCFVRAST